MKLLLIWLLGVPALVVGMAIVSQVIGCRNYQAGQSSQSSSRCLAVASISRAR